MNPLQKQCSLILSNHVARLRDYNVEMILEVFQHTDHIECTITEVDKPDTKEVECYSEFNVDCLVREVRNFAIRHSRLNPWQRNLYDSLLA